MGIRICSDGWKTKRSVKDVLVVLLASAIPGPARQGQTRERERERGGGGEREGEREREI